MIEHLIKLFKRLKQIYENTSVGKMVGYKSLLNIVLILGTVSGRKTRSTAATTVTTTTAVAVSTYN